MFLKIFEKLTNSIQEKIKNKKQTKKKTGLAYESWQICYLILIDLYCFPIILFRHTQKLIHALLLSDDWILPFYLK